MEDDPVLTTEEVADILRVHPATVTTLIRDGKLRAFKLSRRYRVRRSDLTEFMNKEAKDARRTN